MKTHRCEESLKNEISVRYCKKYEEWNFNDDYETWRLFKAEFFDDCDGRYLNHITKIKYCPFCGIRLED